MKSFRIRTMLPVLCMLLALLLSGCSFHINTSLKNPSGQPEECTEALRAMLDAILAEDEEKALSLQHPEADVTEEQFHSFFSQLPRYMPLTEDYELSVESCDIYTKADFGSRQKTKTVSGVYRIDFDDQSFYAIFSYRSDAAGEGFEKLRFLNEADYAVFRGIG